MVVDDGGAVDGSSVEAAVPACVAVDCAASRNWREGGRDLERTCLVGPMADVAFSGTDIRLSGGKVIEGIMGIDRV